MNLSNCIVFSFLQLCIYERNTMYNVRIHYIFMFTFSVHCTLYSTHDTLYTVHCVHHSWFVRTLRTFNSRDQV